MKFIDDETRPHLQKFDIRVVNGGGDLVKTFGDIDATFKQLPKMFGTTVPLVRAVPEKDMAETALKLLEARSMALVLQGGGMVSWLDNWGFHGKISIMTTGLKTLLLTAHNADVELTAEEDIKIPGGWNYRKLHGLDGELEIINELLRHPNGHRFLGVVTAMKFSNTKRPHVCAECLQQNVKVTAMLGKNVLMKACSFANLGDTEQFLRGYGVHAGDHD